LRVIPQQGCAVGSVGRMTRSAAVTTIRKVYGTGVPSGILEIVFCTGDASERDRRAKRQYQGCQGQAGRFQMPTNGFQFCVPSTVANKTASSGVFAVLLVR
jgi:hypothetical protein